MERFQYTYLLLASAALLSVSNQVFAQSEQTTLALKVPILLRGLGIGLPVLGQDPAPNDIPLTPGPDPHNLSAYWELKDLPGYQPSRDMHAEFMAEYKRKLEEEDTARARSNTPRSYIPTASGACTPMGMPFMMGQSPPINITQGSDEILVFSEQHSSGRHIYLDGRPHPAPEYLDRTTNGHSIGHWEGNVLVVDTVGFIDDQGMTSVVGGGVRRSTSHLIERFHLVDGGAKLWYEATWDDPTMYAKPLSYTYIYFRGSADTFSIDEFCDAGASKQRKL